MKVLFFAQLRELLDCDSAELNMPTCVLESCKSGCTNGIRKLSAFRSKNRMPKLRLSSAVTHTW